MRTASNNKAMRPDGTKDRDLRDLRDPDDRDHQPATADDAEENDR